MNEAALPQSTVHIAQADPDGILLVIHAGAGNRGKKDTPERRAQVEQDLNRALEAGYALLEQGAPAEDAVCAAIRVMEDAPEFNAGRGAALTSEGIVSMDSCLMTGVDGEVGSACGLTTSKNPINVARAIKEKTKHVMFAKPGNDLLKEWGIELCDSEYFITPARQESLREAQSNGDEWEKHGTIGAVARDSFGNIAAGTSTGGITNQMPGRVGDSPLPGCGTYANNDSVAISCTGIGEAFVKEVAAHQVSDRVLHIGGETPGVGEGMGGYCLAVGELPAFLQLDRVLGGILVRGDTLGDFEMLLAFCIEAHQTFEQVSNNFAAAHFIGVAWN